MEDRALKVMSVFGTRPEAVKMCPLILRLQRTDGIRSIVCLTGQHREMLDQVMESFHVTADYDLDLMRPEQTLTEVTAGVLQGLEPILIREAPDIVLVHGDTASSLAAAMAAFYRRIPVAHVEAGLRTYHKYAPFPEEVNRLMLSRLADWHFAPTEGNAENLKREGITENVFVTGNTVIDAIRLTVRDGYRFHSPALRDFDAFPGRTVLLTAHRRENFGEPLENICRAAVRLTRELPDVRLIYPVHLNPAVRSVAERILSGQERILLCEPLSVADMHNLIARSTLVMTDSGGLQEEAPACGVPVLVLRRETERPEAVEAGTVRVVGTDEESIFAGAVTLLTDREQYDAMAHAVNPYGDGHASERIVRCLLRAKKTEIN